MVAAVAQRRGQTLDVLKVGLRTGAVGKDTDFNYECLRNERMDPS